MIGLAGSEQHIMFGFGPTEIGLFMTGVGELHRQLPPSIAFKLLQGRCIHVCFVPPGLFQIVGNAVLSPKIIRCLGLKNTLLLGTFCIGVGILYPLIQVFILQLLLWLPLVAVSPSCSTHAP